MRRAIRLALPAAFVAAALAAAATAPRALVNQAVMPLVAGDPDAWLADRERTAVLDGELVPGTEKRIRWFGPGRGARTRYAIVYLHGFSATRQEIAPVGEWVADALGANLFETRLHGHGLVREPLAGVRAEDWLYDAAEALAIGAAIGDEIILMGTSTGATLALAMSGHESFDRVAALVLLSPNFAPSDPNAEYLTWPGGPQLARIVAGDTHSWTPRNALQARFWSTSYPMDAVIEMMRLVKFVRNQLPIHLEQPLLVIYSPADQVVDTDWITRAYGQIRSPRKQLVEVQRSGDPGNHVLAGSILSPETSREVADSVVRFIHDSGEALGLAPFEGNLEAEDTAVSGGDFEWDRPPAGQGSPGHHQHQVIAARLQ